jgi:hypothetical protein
MDSSLDSVMCKLQDSSATQPNCFQETHIRPAHTLNIRGFTPYRYDHQDGERANGWTAILAQDHIHSSGVNLRTTLQASDVHLTTPSLSFSICNIYLPPKVPTDRTELSHLLYNFWCKRWVGFYPFKHRWEHALVPRFRNLLCPGPSVL